MSKIEDLEGFKEIKKTIDDYVKVFVKGQGLTTLEKVIEKEYLIVKYQKKRAKRQYEERTDKIVLTDDNCIKLLGIRNINIDFSKIHLDGYKTSRTDIFKVNRHFKKNNNAIDYIENKHLLHSLHKKSKYIFVFKLSILQNALSFINQTDKNIELQTIKTITFFYMMNIVSFIESEKFLRFVDTGFDFFIHHFILCMHIWLIVERFSHFQVSLLLNKEK